MIKRIYRFFSKPINLGILNGILITILIVLNIYFQAFCVPSNWTIILLTICFINTILFPFFEKSNLAPLTSFINGISIFVFIYCVIFLEHMNLFGLVTIPMGIGLAILSPHFFIFQLIWKNVFKPSVKTSRYYFLCAMAFCIGGIVYIGQDYKEAINSIEKFKATNYKELDKNYMTEKILGMHFIYHTRYCEFDGWRPPKHDPILVIGMWLNKRIDPLEVDLKTRLELYKTFFPDNKYKFDCSCGFQYKNSYHNDNLWK